MKAHTRNHPSFTCLKFICALSIILFNSTSVFSQAAILWQKCLGTLTSEHATQVSQCADAGFIVGGYMNNSGSGNDYLLVKTDSAGNQQWVQGYGGSLEDVAETAFQCSDGGYIIGGRTFSSDGDVTGFHGTNPNFFDAWIVKTDALGVLQWERACGGNNSDAFESGVQLGNGNFVMAGYAASHDGDLAGLPWFNSPQIWLVLFDSVGTILNQNVIGGVSNDCVFDIIQTNDGGFAIAGASAGAGNEIDTNYGGWDVCIAKFDSVLAYEWSHVYGGTDVEQGYDIQQTSDGGYVIAGVTKSNNVFVSGNHGYYDYWIVKTDNLGNFLWQKCLGGSDYEDAYAIIENADGNFIVTGRPFGSVDGDITNPIANGMDIWIACVDATGNLLWEKSIGGGLYDSAESMIKTNDGKIVIAGSTSSKDRDVSGNISQSSGTDFWLVKLDDHPNSVTGTIFADLNSDMFQDVQESPIIIHRVEDQNSGRTGYSRSDGFYRVDVSGPGSVVAVPDSVVYYSSSPLSHTVTFVGTNQIDSLNDFAFQPSGIFNDLQVSLTNMFAVRPGFPVVFQLKYTNTGTTILNGSVSVASPSFLVYTSATETPSFILTDSLIWTFNSLAPFESHTVDITYTADVAVWIGTTFNMIGSIEPIATDYTPDNNRDTITDIVVGSIDPNDISVDLDTISSGWNLPFLEYVIRFQNTGTAPATFVRVTNPVSHKLDMSTFELVSTSHNASTIFLQHSRNLEFFFDNINLADSLSNEPESHGFIRYRVKPISPAIPGDSILNFANIYFDYNAPVVTNIVKTTVDMTVSINEHFSTEKTAFAYPNPVDDETLILYTPKNLSGNLEVFDILGNLVEKDIISAHSQSKIISLKHYRQGIYYCRLSWNDSHAVIKLVKK